MFGRNRNRKKLLERFGKRKEGFFDFNGIQEYAFKKQLKQSEYVNDRTWNDLDMNELFMFTDRCSSAIGQQMLYARLKGLSSFSSARQWEEQIESLKADQELRENVIVELNDLQDDDAYQLHGLFH